MSERDDDAVRAGLDHLQAAALELIAATRAFLDVAEDLVREPGVAATFVRTAAGMAAALRGDGPAPEKQHDEHDGSVRRIRLS
jgi:hypothetical protein